MYTVYVRKSRWVVDHTIALDAGIYSTSELLSEFGSDVRVRSGVTMVMAVCRGGADAV